MVSELDVYFLSSDQILPIFLENKTEKCTKSPEKQKTDSAYPWLQREGVLLIEIRMVPLRPAIVR